MRMETPFTGQLAVLGETSRSGLNMALDGVWELREGAPVTHATQMGGVHYFPTAIGEMHSLVIRETGGMVQLWVEGMGVSWLSELLDKGTHKLSMDMDLVNVDHKTALVKSGRVRGALLVQPTAFGWEQS